MTKVLDACALIAYLEKEPGYETVKGLFIQAVEHEKKILMSTVNWGEVYYLLVREYGDKAEHFIRIIETFPIEMVVPDIALTRQAALFKAHKKLPYVDAYAAALAKLRKGELVTADKEFKAIEHDIKILWL